MLPHQLERVRIKSADMAKSYLDAAVEVSGSVALAHAANGIMSAVAAHLVKQYGEAEAYRMMSSAADAIIDDSAMSKKYLSACLSGIIQAAKNPKRQ